MSVIQWNIEQWHVVAFSAIGRHSTRHRQEKRTAHCLEYRFLVRKYTALATLVRRTSMFTIAIAFFSLSVPYQRYTRV